MKTRLFAGILGACLLLAPLSAQERKSSRNHTQDSDMQRAIAEEHYKDMASARQARMESRHSVDNSNADRQADRDDQDPGRKVKPRDPVRK